MSQNKDDTNSSLNFDKVRKLPETDKRSRYFFGESVEIGDENTLYECCGWLRKVKRLFRKSSNQAHQKFLNSS